MKEDKKISKATDRELLEELARRNEVSYSPNTIRLDPETNQEFTVGVGKDHTATVLLDWGENEEWPAWDEYS